MCDKIDQKKKNIKIKINYIFTEFKIYTGNLI